MFKTKNLFKIKGQKSYSASRTLLIISLTLRSIFESSSIFFWISFMLYITVEYVLPNSLPICSSVIVVISRIIYIHIFLASVMFAFWREERISSGETPCILETSSIMRSTVTGMGGTSSSITSLIIFCTAAMVGSRWARLSSAESFLTVPSSWRIFVFILFAMYSTTSLGILTPKRFALFLMIRQRVSNSGLCMSARIPPSNLETSLSVRLFISLGGRSEVSTICLPFSIRELKVWKNSSSVCTLPEMN